MDKSSLKFLFAVRGLGNGKNGTCYLGLQLVFLGEFIISSLGGGLYYQWGLVSPRRYHFSRVVHSTVGFRV